MFVSIYRLIDPREKLVCYIGKSANPGYRLYGHLRDSRPTFHGRWIRSLKRKQLKPKLEILEIVLMIEWEARERFWIAEFKRRGWILTNASTGGGGPHGWKMSAKQKAQVSKVHKGKTLSLSHRAAIRKAQLGRKHSVAACLAKSAALKGRVLSPLWIRRVRAGLKRYHVNKRLINHVTPEPFQITSTI